MVRRISIDAGCVPAPRRASTPCSQKGVGSNTAPQADGDIHQITFCFQAWHINNHPVSESAVNNRKMAEFIQSSLSGESASRWIVTTSPPLRPRPSLAAPVSIRVKRKPRADTELPKSPVEDDNTALVLEFVRFRDQEYPHLAKDYFTNNLRRRLDFHNVFAITTSGTRVESLEKVVVSAKLNLHMAAALSTFGRQTAGDVSEGFTSPSNGRPATPEEPFKARLFLHRRYSDAWSLASDEVITRPGTPTGVQSIADEDETVVGHEEEHHEERVCEERGDEGREDEERCCEERDGEEWENISEKEAQEACAEEAAVVADKSTETQKDGPLPKIISNSLGRTIPGFPFDLAWYILKPYMTFQARLAAVTRCARVLASSNVHPYDTILKKLNTVAIRGYRSKAPARSYKLLTNSRASRRALPRGFSVSASLALAGARWILRQVKQVLRRVGRMMLMQNIR